jgi:cardiolipin synthase
MRTFVKKWRYGFIALWVIFLASLPSCSPMSDAVPVDVEVAGDNLNAILDVYTDSRRDADSAMELFSEGEQAYAAFVEVIESAKDHINIESLNFDTDELGIEMAERLADKARAGVEVNVILDPVFQKFIAEPTAVKILLEGGVHVRYFMPPLEKLLLEQVTYRTHKKLLVADGLRAITGGSNFGSRYLGADQWRDTNVLLTGPVVASVQREFLRDWQALGDAVTDEDWFFPSLSPTGDLAIRVLDQRPAEDDFDISQAVLIALRAAEDEIVFETPYFNPPDWLAEELVAAAGRGVRVRVLVNSRESSDMTEMYWASAFHFQDLIANGVEVYLWDRGDRTIHSKVLVVDDRLALVTSYNFSYRSSILDAENGVIFTDSEPVARIRAMLEEDFDQDFIFAVDQTWLGLQAAMEEESWRMANIFGWLF